MRLIPILVMLAVLAGCNTPGRGFGGIDPVTVTSGGSRFDIRRRGDMAEVMRVSPHALPRYDTVAARGAVAVVRVTGCIPKWIVGDPSVMTMGLSCGGRPAPDIPKRSRTLNCDITQLGPVRGGVQEGLLECRLE